ncbi:hypothetical protein GJ496_007426 [Pomphorhynchus laevis]|nr:hypothetical protein GJ496_007426 [Pomphorhynchus laevis]
MNANSICRFASILKGYKQAYSHCSFQRSFISQPLKFLRNISSSNLPKHQVLNLPALSPTMDTGNLISWAVKEGDKVDEGDVLAEIETDKASIGFEVVDGGYVAKLLVDAGTKGISLGTPICIMVDTPEDVEKFKNYSVAEVNEKSGEFTADRNIEDQFVKSQELVDTRSSENESVDPMVISKALIPHYYLNSTINYDQIDNLKRQNSKISSMSVIAKATAIALQQIPDVNSVWADTVIRKNNSIMIKIVNGEQIDILENSHLHTLEQISKQLSPAKVENSKKIDPKSSNATFTIRFLPDIKSCAGIINPKQAAVLCVGGIYSEVAAENKSFKVSSVANVTLSCDHRVVDGAVGAEWLQKFTRLVNYPALMAS